MPSYPYKKIDAFASGTSSGNPAACLFLRDGERLDDADMQAIARQHKGFVSEVAYCTRQGPADYAVRYFSSESEVGFCGHATVALAYSLLKDASGPTPPAHLRFHTRAKGTVLVHNELAERDAVFIAAPEAAFIGTSLSLPEVAGALGCGAAALTDRHPLDVVDAGLRTLIVPVGQLADEVSLFPDPPRLKAFCERHDLDIVLIHCLEASTPDAFAHTRVFAPRFGYLEDPATGSGNSAFGYYLLKNGLWNGGPVQLEQGGADRVYNTVHLVRRDDRVLFGGSAATRIDGRYHYP